MVADHAEIMAKLLEDTMGEENVVCPDSPEPNVEPEEEDDEEEKDDAPQSSWMAKGPKRQKIIPIPSQVRQRTLQILPGNSQYFANMRKSYL